MATIGLVLFFSSWFMLTLISNASTKTSAWIAERDFLELVPDWHFFAPKPLKSDYYLLTRVVKEDQQPMTDWLPVRLDRSRQPFYFIWNPQKRALKVIVDTVTCMKVYQEVAETEAIQLTLPYILLLELASREVQDHGGGLVQFLIAEKVGTEPVESAQAFFVSYLHRIESPQ